MGDFEKAIRQHNLQRQAKVTGEVINMDDNIDLIKGKELPIGTERKHGGKLMVKTAQGWKLKGEDKKSENAVEKTDIITRAGLSKQYKAGRKVIENKYQSLIDLAETQNEKMRYAKERNQELANHYNNALKLAEKKIKESIELTARHGSKKDLYEAVNKKHNTSFKQGDIEEFEDDDMRTQLTEEDIKNIVEAEKEDREIEVIGGYVEKWKQKMSGDSMDTAKEWVNGIGGLSKEAKATLLEKIKPFTNGGNLKKALDTINDFVSNDDFLEKGKALPIGTIKKRGASNFIKTATGWKYHSRANKSSGGEEKDPLIVDDGTGFGHNVNKKQVSLKQVLATKEGKKLIETIEEYLGDLRDQPGRKEHMDGLRDTVEQLEKKTGYKYDIRQQEHSYRKASKPNAPDVVGQFKESADKAQIKKTHFNFSPSQHRSKAKAIDRKISKMKKEDRSKPSGQKRTIAIKELEKKSKLHREIANEKEGRDIKKALDVIDSFNTYLTDEDLLIKGKALPVGTIKKRGPNNFIKTASGWKYHSRAGKEGAKKDDKDDRQKEAEKIWNSQSESSKNIYHAIAVGEIYRSNPNKTVKDAADHFKTDERTATKILMLAENHKSNPIKENILGKLKGNVKLGEVLKKIQKGSNNIVVKFKKNRYGSDNHSLILMAKGAPDSFMDIIQPGDLHKLKDETGVLIELQTVKWTTEKSELTMRDLIELTQDRKKQST